MARLLLVEDELALRELYGEICTDAGYEVTLASSSDEAIRLHHEKVFQIIVADYNLGKDTAISLMLSLKSNGWVPIILMSGNPIHRAASIFGADATLQKPFHPSVLLETIAKLLGSK